MSNKANANPQTGDALNAEKVLGTNKVLTLDTTGYAEIPEGADLNDEKYKQFGAYACPLTVRARTLINCPTEVAFRMYVVPGTGIGWGYPLQIIYPLNIGIEFRRVWMVDNKVWGGWREPAQVEAGTWTPKLTDRSGGYAVIEEHSCFYTKVGNLVHITASLKLKSKGTLGESKNIFIQGLPFISKVYTSATFAWWAGARLPNGFGGETSTEIVNLYKPAENGVTNVKVADIDNNFSFEDFSCVYQIK